MKKLIAPLIGVLLLAGCGGGISSPNQNKFISGSGAAVYIKASDRKIAPNIVGTTITGETFSSPKNQIIVLNVWASWCSPCRAEAPTLEALSQKFPKVQFVGVLTRDNVTAARSFIERFKLTYPTITDDSVLASFRGSLPPNAIPTTLVIDSSGYVAARISGAVTVGLLTDLINNVSGDPRHA